MSSSYSLKTSPAKRKRRGWYITCQTCGQQFYAPPSRIAYVEHQGNQVRYCSMACRAQGYKGIGNPMWGRKHTQKSIEKMVAHPNRSRFPKGITNPTYWQQKRIPTLTSRRETWKVYIVELRGNVCQRCGLSGCPVIQLHHIDSNCKNNQGDNFILLCPTCHELTHYEEHTGKYRIHNHW